MPEVKIVDRGVDTLVINVCYANKHFQPVKQELAKGVQHELEIGRSPLDVQQQMGAYHIDNDEPLCFTDNGTPV